MNFWIPSRLLNILRERAEKQALPCKEFIRRLIQRVLDEPDLLDGYSKALAEVRCLIMEKKKKDEFCIIGIDGRDGSGKTTLASWLAWNLSIPVVHLDFYYKFFMCEDFLIQERMIDLRNTISNRISDKRPVIVEGVLLLETLRRIGLSPDYLVYVHCEELPDGPLFFRIIQPYMDTWEPQKRANSIVSRVESSG
ncbi:MAG: hypothetical protein ACOVVK_20860 [Elsteraceae bacterium]